MSYANNKCADQPANPHNLISTLVVRSTYKQRLLQVFVAVQDVWVLPGRTTQTEVFCMTWLKQCPTWGRGKLHSQEPIQRTWNKTWAKHSWKHVARIRWLKTFKFIWVWIAMWAERCVLCPEPEGGIVACCRFDIRETLLEVWNSVG